VTQAVEAGAALRTGGSVPNGRGAFYPATVLTGCTDAMAVMREETFGPVAPVAVVGSFEEGLARAAAGSYGLAASVLTRDLAHAQRAWRDLPAGTVKINDVFGGAPGGAAEPRGRSGTGFGYGPELLDELTARVGDAVDTVRGLDQAGRQLTLGRAEGLRSVCERLVALT
jgi:succinate-semialdehyde dehydrogenase/glutarate-semialdehyde dehydrogenase